MATAPRLQSPRQLATHPAVDAACVWLRQQDAALTQLQVDFACLPSPDLRATPRAALFESRARDVGLVDVQIDAVGNVRGSIPGSAPHMPALVLSAHLDSVFPHLQDITVQRDGSVLRAPGIADDAAGLTAILYLAQAVRRSGLSLQRTVHVVATVGEEGDGDLAGVKHLFSQWTADDVAAFLTLDLGSQRHAAHAALGSRRFAVEVRGPGGHSWGDFGRPNPIHALSRGVALFLHGRSALHDTGSWNVGTIEGGSGVNAIPERAHLRVDLRSRDEAALRELVSGFRRAIEQGVQAEEDAAKPHAGHLECSVRSIGDRPTGTTPLDSWLVQTVGAAFAVRQQPLEFTRSSTDANVPMSRGIPALALPHGARAYNAHSEQEWCDVAGRPPVLEAELLAVLALAGVPDTDT